MAEAALFSLAGKLLATIASPAFKKGYERIRSIWAAKNELEELTDTIQTIQALLLDAEKQQEHSDMVNNLIVRIRDVLYEADDLFDQVATNELLKQQMEGKKHLKEVHVFFSKLNPVLSRDSIAKKVKAIRKSLLKISNDMVAFNFVELKHEDTISGMRRGVETGSFVDPKVVFGRDDEKKVILDFLNDKSYADKNISVIAIVGIGGMGKSTLAQLVYNDGMVSNDFDERRRWWACISDVLDEKEVKGKIFQSLTEEPYQNFNVDMLQNKIRECLSRDGKFLLVLDDLWDDNSARGQNLLFLLSSDNAKGSKVIITTRSLSVAKAMSADKILDLKSLSDGESWELFKRFAFTREQENDPERNILGRKIMEKCANVPLAIKCIASLLHTRDTIEEWKSFENEELAKIELGDIMSTLRLSYNHLPSNLKHCFAYCSLFPKDTTLYKEKLICLWIAQGYVRTGNYGTLEAAGHAYFMELLRRSFFQEAEEGFNGQIHCKMHDLIHDLAQNLAGKESIIVAGGSNQFDRKIRHVALGCDIGNSWDIPPPLLEAGRLRSFLHTRGILHSSRVLYQQVAKFKFLRALDLHDLFLENVPCSIGELIYLRYLNLSRSRIHYLPDSITKLVNLLTLDISYCKLLKEFPKDFRRLISLKHLYNSECDDLWHMPSGFGEMTSLERLSAFKVTESCGLDALARLNLQGELEIRYEYNEDWQKDDLIMLKRGQIPEGIQVLTIRGYPSMTIPVWWREDLTSQLYKIKYLALKFCRVKHLPPLRCLPYLRFLQLYNLLQLEYIEEYEADSTKPFFPSLQHLQLSGLPSFKGWSRGLKALTARFPADNEDHSVKYLQHPPFLLLSFIFVADCYHLKSMPPTPHLQRLHLLRVTKEVIEQLVSTCSMSSPSTSTSTPSSSLNEVEITEPDNDLTSLSIEGLTSLHKLRISRCTYLKNVQLASNALEELNIFQCPELKLWDNKEDEGRGINWGSLTKLRLLTHDETTEAEKLPDCVRHRIAQGNLQIR